MKKYIVAALFFLAASISHGQQLGTDGGIATSFTIASGNLCSTSVINSCLQGVTVTYTEPTGKIYTLPTCSSTVTANCMNVVIGVNTYTFRPGGNLVCGTWNLSAVATWLNNATPPAPVTSTAVPATTVEPCPFVPSPVTNLSAKPVQ